MEDVVCLSNFLDYKCKCSACRNTCCKYWHITLSEDEYFKTTSLECSPELKSKINNAFYVIPHPSEDKYADINLTYEGTCPLLNEQGYCSLQCECGEKSLPSICVNYPRSNRFIENQEIALSTSCEKVVETLFIDTPIKLTTVQMDDNFFCLKIDEHNIPEIKIRSKVFELLQKPNANIQNQIKNLATSLASFSSKPITLDYKYWDSSEIAFINKIFEILFSRDLYISNFEQLHIDYTINELTNKLDDFYINNPETKQYIINILINHLFYMNFPFCENRADYETHILGLNTIYHIVEFLFVIFYDKNNTDKLIDYLAFSFKIFEHTNFYHNCRVVYNGIN